MMPARHPGLARPTAETARADVLDALRGFALLGIFISHVPDFSGYAALPPADQLALDRFGIDHATAVVQDFLIRGKFYSLFSLLFGIGFALQLDGAARRDADFVRHFVRRLGALLAIGLIHASLWYGDILKDYALIGFILIPSRHWTISTLAKVAALAFALRLVWPLAIAVVVPLVMPAGRDAAADGGFDTIAQAFGGSDLSAVFHANLQLVRLKALQTVYEGRAVSILAMFMLGALVGRLGLYRDLGEHRELFRRVLWVAAPVGLVGNAVLTPLHATTPDFPPTAAWVIENMVYAVAVPALAIAYASAFALLWSDGARAALDWLAPAGRMALSTYVAQTLIGITLFYGIGIGLRGHVGLVEGTLLAVAIFVAQCALARHWLRHYRFGPLEWVWRRATYGTPIPFRRERGG